MDRIEERSYLIRLSKTIQNLELYNKGLVQEENMPYFMRNLMFCNNKPFNLPSKRKGDILALALELNFYNSALYLIKNAIIYNIDLNNIAYSGKKTFSVADELKYSMETMGDYQRLCDDFLRPMLELNINAFEDICKIFNVKEKNRLSK